MRIGPFLFFALVALLTGQIEAQRTIPFKIASEDRTAVYWSDKWTVMGALEGELSVAENVGEIHIKVENGHLIAPRSAQTNVSIRPYLAVRTGKMFKPAIESNARLDVTRSLPAATKTEIQKHEFLLKFPQSTELSDMWLVFEIRFSCDEPIRGTYCTTYVHSRPDIFRR